METAAGRIESVRDGTMTVIVESPVVCRRCAAGKGCGAGLLTDVEQRRRIDVDIPAGMIPAVGETVSLAISPTQLLKAASIAYGLPLLALVIGAALASLLGIGADSPVAIGLALGGLLAGVMTSRRLLARDRACEHFVPSVERRHQA